MLKFLKKIQTRGFSLIELLIAVSIFLVITVAAIGSMTHLQGAAEQGKDIYATLDNLNLTIDSMSRLMRTGYSYHCGGGDLTKPADCPYNGNQNDGGTSFAFYDQSGALIQFKLDIDSIPGKSFIAMNTGSGFVPITSSDINIQRFKIYVEGSTRADKLQPYATMILAGQLTRSGKVVSSFNIETSMTQRLPDATP